MVYHIAGMNPGFSEGPHPGSISPCVSRSNKSRDMLYGKDSTIYGPRIGSCYFLLRTDKYDLKLRMTPRPSRVSARKVGRGHVLGCHVRIHLIRALVCVTSYSRSATHVHEKILRLRTDQPHTVYIPRSPPNFFNLFFLLFFFSSLCLLA